MIERPVVGHPGYMVSDQGTVRSVDRVVQTVRGPWRYRGKQLRPGVASNDYPTVSIGSNNSRTVHSLVAEAFLGPCPVGMEVRHINGRRDDPRAVNLEYGTRRDNILDAKAHGTFKAFCPGPVHWSELPL